MCINFNFFVFFFIRILTRGFGFGILEWNLTFFSFSTDVSCFLFSAMGLNK